MTSSDQLEYSRRLYENVREWYDNADKKAQTILTLAGIFISFFTGSIFLKKEDFIGIFKNFSIVTYLLLFLMMATAAGSIISALLCLWSRHGMASFSINNKEEQYSARYMGFFKHISDLDDDELFKNRLHEVSEEFEVDALAYQIRALSKNVTKKHNHVNYGFLLLTISLLSLLLMAMSYLYNIQFTKLF